MGRQNKIFFLSILFSINLFLMGRGNPVLAQYVPPPYGEPTPSGQILIDKKVKDPASEDYVDNLGVNDYRFAPGEEIYFKITVKNNGETTFEKVAVKDILPPYVEYVSGPTEIEYGNLGPDESREFEILARVVSAEGLPNDQGLYCVINRAEVIADDQTDRDAAQLCIEKKVLGITTHPTVGTNIWVLVLGFLGVSFLGLIMEKNKFFLKVRKMQ